MNASIKTMPVLMRREIWEHRVLWIVPLIVAALYIAACLIPGGINISGAERGFGGFESDGATQARGVVVFAGIQLAFMAVLFSLMSIVAFFYLSDCLYAERKDRSILFWKSLPVSDMATVLSKFLVATLVLPVGVYLLALVTNLLAFGIIYARFHDSPIIQYVRWDGGAWLRLNGLLLADVLVLALWFAPVAAYQLLVSAWAKSSVLVWTLFPPLALILGEKLIFGSWNIAHAIGYRLGRGMTAGGAGFATMDRSHPTGINSILENVNVLPLLANRDLWLGVIVAAVLVFVTIRIRRYRDDS